MGIPIPEFKILLYGPSMHPAGVRARARFEGGVLAVSTHNGSFLVPPNLITLRTGGYDGRQWLITWPAKEGTYSAMLQGEAALEAFIHLAPPRIGRQLLRARESQARIGRRFMLGLVLLALVLLLAMGLFWTNADRLSQSAVSHISLEQEQKLGVLAYAQIRPSLKLVEQGPASAAVEAIGQRLTADSNYRYQFHVADDPEINAFALPGGQIVIYTGLLKAADSAEEVAGVLAHEISHVEQRHVLRNMIHALGWRAILGVALGDFSGGLWGGMAVRLGSLSYSRELEGKADLGGLVVLRRAMVAPNGMETFFAKMAKKENGLRNLLARHPASEERLADLRAAIARQPHYGIHPLNIDWKHVRPSYERQRTERASWRV